MKDSARERKKGITNEVIETNTSTDSNHGGTPQSPSSSALPDSEFVATSVFSVWMKDNSIPNFLYWCHRDSTLYQLLCTIKVLVLVVLSLQNSLFTVLRRYSQGVLHEDYSKYEVLLVGEIIKLIFSAYMIHLGLQSDPTDASLLSSASAKDRSVTPRLHYLVTKSSKMVGLALIYGAMNILSFVSLRNIGAGMFTIFAQCKILSTALFSTILLRRSYSWVQWRALASLFFGVLLFSYPIWGNSENLLSERNDANVMLGVVAVLIEVTLSGFASIYFEKVIKTDPLQLTIWERNFQLALGSFPVYLAFMAWDGGGKLGYFGGWSWVAVVVASLGAAGGLLVALSIKYGDSILKTLATTAAIILSSVLDWAFLGGPLTSIMCIAGVQVVLSIVNYTFDPTPKPFAPTESGNHMMFKDSDRPSRSSRIDEEVGLIQAEQRTKTTLEGEEVATGSKE